MTSSAKAPRWSPLLALLWCATADAQAPLLHAAIAASEHRGGVPAVAWLCEEYLPGLPSWPEDLDPRESFTLSVSTEGWSASATEVPLPEDAVAVGYAASSDAPDSPTVLWRCGRDGDSEWTVPADFQPPRAWTDLLRSLEADVLDTPRSLALPVLAGHLSGGLLEGDPRAPLLRICPALCGDVTWMAREFDGKVEVRGRSSGGLMLPLVLLLAATAEAHAETQPLQLRSFAARDGDRAEATRQLARDDRRLDQQTLRSLLFGDDELRLTAARALVRRGAADSLPQIIDAAAPDMPWATLAARDAVHHLWPTADEATRRRCVQALERSRCPQLRALDLAALDAPPAPDAPVAPEEAPRVRAFAILVCTGIGLLGLWSRARARARLQPTPARAVS